MTIAKLIIDLVTDLLACVRDPDVDGDALRAKVQTRLAAASVDLDNLDEIQAKRWRELHEAVPE